MLLKMIKMSAVAMLAVFLTLCIWYSYITVWPASEKSYHGKQMRDVWTEFPFTSQYIEVNGHYLHYIDEGPASGPVFLLIHGNPTSSYMWRSVIPELVTAGNRVIAFDLAGFGASDKPDIAYSYSDHSERLKQFIHKLGLRSFVLVLHDWGSALGFDFASLHSGQVSGIVFFEAILSPDFTRSLNQKAQNLFSLIKTPVIGEFMVMGMNLFIEGMLPSGTMTGLTEQEIASYRFPFKNQIDRRPILAWINELPEETATDASIVISQYMQWLPQSNIPKLHFYSSPGVLISESHAEEMRKSWKFLTSKYLGDGYHFLADDHGELIGHQIALWHKSNVMKKQNLEVVRE